MARLGCKCGAEMTNTEAPSKHEINVFYMTEAESAIQMNPEIRLWDFYSGWDEKNNCPVSFYDYPLLPKLEAYTRGISKVVANDHYAGFLCSKHYASESKL